MNIQTLFGLFGFIAFGLGLILFTIYKAKTTSFITLDRYALIGYFGKGLVAMAILFNAIGNYYGGIEIEKDED
jgi:hypothetical protein